MVDHALPTPSAKRGLTRRQALGCAWLAGLGTLAASLTSMGLFSALPRPRAGEFGGVFTIGQVADLPAPDAAPVNYPAGKFWLTHTSDGLLALHKVCTHLDCLFNWNEQAGKFVCPCHGSQFARDGTRLSGPASRSLDRFVVQLLTPQGELLAETDPETGAPLPVSVAHNPASHLPIGPTTVVQVDTGRIIAGS